MKTITPGRWEVRPAMTDEKTLDLITINPTQTKTFITFRNDGTIELGPDLSMDEATQKAASLLYEHYGRAKDAALTVERERAEKAEARLTETEKLLDEAIARAHVLHRKWAKAEAEQNEARRNLSIARSDGHHDGWRDACLASPLNVDRIERETIERCAKMVDEIAERHREASVKCHEEGLKDASQLASYAARSVDDIAAAIRAMREESHG